MTYASVRAAAEHVARTGRITPHQLAAFTRLWETMTTAQKKEFTELWRAEGSPAAQAPVAANSWEGICAAAQAAGARYPELVAAQWALESAHGKVPSGRNNYWGLKGTGTAKPTWEVVSGQKVNVVASFLDFDSIAAGVEYLVSRWYRDFKGYKGVNNAASRQDAARSLVSQGYATDPAYAQKLIALMDQHAPKQKLSVPAQQGAKVPAHLRLTRTGQVDERGLELLRLQEVVDGIPMGELLVVSGAPGAQQFKRGRESRAGSLEPLPEGRYGVEDIEWKGGKDNYVGTWGPGLGPVWVGINYQAPGKTERSALGIHLDENQGTNPGTAGCIGIRSVADLKRFVALLRAHDPQCLYVDYGLGSCPPIRPL